MNFLAHTGARRPAGGYKNPNYDPEEAHRYYEEHKKLKGRRKPQNGPIPTGKKPTGEQSLRNEPREQLRNPISNRQGLRSAPGRERLRTQEDNSRIRRESSGKTPITSSTNGKKPTNTPTLRNERREELRNPISNRQSLRSESTNERIRRNLKTPSDNSKTPINISTNGKKPTGAPALRNERREELRNPISNNQSLRSESVNERIRRNLKTPRNNSKTPINISTNGKKPSSTSSLRSPEVERSRSPKTPKTPGAVERKIEGYTNWMNSIMEANARRQSEEIARTARAVAGREWLRDTFQNPNLLYSHNGRTIYSVEQLTSDPAVRQLIRQLTGK